MSYPTTLPQPRLRNKTRLKIVFKSSDALSFISAEDDVKERLQHSVAGVDDNDVNEHHLQQVIAATTHKKDAPAAYIPTPDSTGLVPNYEELYPQDSWKTPACYVASSQTVEESIEYALQGGFAYYMDERDLIWLEKNNEVARGEGTSMQGIILSPLSPNGVRTSPRSSRTKGKETETIQPVIVSEDVFELVMALYEKITHERTEFLHHSLETGMPFPAFSDYEDVFYAPLLPHHFMSMTSPKWLPTPPELHCIARVVYPHWRERRLERNGKCIIPTLNFDELDVQNETYVCFRKHDTKLARKTRSSQVNSLDKLNRLQEELGSAYELAQSVLSREKRKRDSEETSHYVFERRIALVQLKNKYPAFNDKRDEELLVDFNPIPQPLRINRPDPAHYSTPPRIRPKERQECLRNQTEFLLDRQRDYNWEDVLDNPYQVQRTPSSWKSIWVGGESKGRANASHSQNRKSRALRCRRGRGGRMFIDRRALPRDHRLALGTAADSDEEEHGDRLRRIRALWRFDEEDSPVEGVSSDEEDRELIDDDDPRYLRERMRMMADTDFGYIMKDPSLLKFHPNGHREIVVPYRLGAMPQQQQRMYPPRTQLHSQQDIPSNDQAPSGNVVVPPAGAPPAQTLSLQDGQSDTQSNTVPTPVSLPVVPEVRPSVNRDLVPASEGQTQSQSLPLQPILRPILDHNNMSQSSPPISRLPYFAHTSVLTPMQMKGLKAAFAPSKPMTGNDLGLFQINVPRQPPNPYLFTPFNPNAPPVAGIPLNLKLPPPRQTSFQWANIPNLNNAGFTTPSDDSPLNESPPNIVNRQRTSSTQSPSPAPSLPTQLSPPVTPSKPPQHIVN